MEALNRAFEDADAFKKMLQKVEREPVQAARPVDPEIEAWNKEVEIRKRMKAEIKAARQRANP